VSKSAKLTTKILVGVN